MLLVESAHGLSCTHACTHVRDTGLQMEHDLKVLDKRNSLQPDPVTPPKRVLEPPQNSAEKCKESRQPIRSENLPGFRSPFATGSSEWPLTKDVFEHHYNQLAKPERREALLQELSQH